MNLLRLTTHLAVLSFVLFMVGCAEVASPARPGVITSTNALRVRTTAYTGKRNAIGKPLSHSHVISAASDWAQFPLGTKFRIRETGDTYIIDDYGWAMIGTRTIDLCMSGSRAMNAWGVRWVNIDVLEWGSPRESLEVLTPREGNRHIKRMISELRHQTKGVPQKFHKLRS